MTRRRFDAGAPAHNAVVTPVSFAVVMATGIVSVAAREDGLRVVSAVLAVVAVVALVVLAVMLATRVARNRRAAADALRRPTVFELLTLVAATDVLGARAQLAGHADLALWLAAFALVACLVLAPCAARVAGRLRRRARGDWLNLVVATQSLAVIAGGHRGLTAAGVTLWLLGLVVYAALIGAILPRMAEAWREPRRHTADTWIVMGALAITTLAGALLNVAGIPTATWALATVAYAALIALEARVALARVAPPAGRRWSTVFPLGMYAACSHAVGLHTLGTVAMGVALAAWLVTTIAVARPSLPGPASRIAGSRQRVRKSI